MEGRSFDECTASLQHTLATCVSSESLPTGVLSGSPGHDRAVVFENSDSISSRCPGYPPQRY